MFNDLKFAFRQLAKSPGFTAIVVLTLALGIGANTTIFNLVNITFLRALPYPEPDGLVHLTERNTTGTSTMPVSYPNFLDWQRQQDVFSGLAAFHGANGKLQTAAGTELVAVQHVSGDFFNVLGVRPALGRSLQPNDDLPGAERVAWLTDAAWWRLFSGEPAVVGRSFPLDGRNLTVAGILPPDFRFHRQTDVFTALAPFAREFLLDMRANHSNEQAVARLKPGVNLEAAQARMAAIALRLAAAYPEANKGIGVAVTPLREQLTGGAGTQLFLLLGAVGLVLLIACVNVANMLLARSISREREMAIRIALGASRWQVLRQLLVESLVLATAGGAAGTLVGVWGYELAVQLVPGPVQQVIDGGDYDLRTLLFVVGITLVTGVAFGLAPAWQLSSLRPVHALKQTGRNVRTGFGRVRLGDLLVVGQVALALVLLIGAGLLIRSLDRLLQVDPGFEPARVLSLEVTAPPSEQFARDPHLFTRHFESVLGPVQNLPGVEAAAVATALPFTFNTSINQFYRLDRPVPAAGEFPSANIHTVSPDYFRVMGIPVLRAFQMMSKRTANRKLRTAVANTAKGIEEGQMIHQAMARNSRVFTPLVINIIRIGEAGGLLESSLVRLAEIMEAKARIMQQLPKPIPPDLGALAVEVSGQIDNRVSTVNVAVNSWGSRAALLASGSLLAAIKGIAWAGGHPSGPPVSGAERATWIGRNADARELVVFTVSDAFLEARIRLGISQDQ